MKGSARAAPALEFAAAEFEVDGRVERLDFALRPGALALVAVEAVDLARLVADAALGLARPRAGAARIFGADWAALAPAEADARRGRVGVAFAEPAMAPHLGVYENLALGPSHHRDLAPERLRAEIAAAARAFGLPGAPGRHLADPLDRRRAALARAFIGEPELILIECVAEPWPRDLVASLLNAAIAACARGAAALWLARAEDLAGLLPPAAAERWSLSHRGAGALEPAA